jgi:hypothetical protein
LHGTGTAYLRGTSSDCAGCHSGGGFSARIAAGLAPDQVKDGDPNPTRQDCRACHQIHTTFTSTDWALETTSPVTLYAINGAIFDGGEGNLCVNCHQPRSDAPVAENGTVTGITTHWGPHHGPQSAMLLGVGGAGATGTPSPHYKAVDNTCVTCHMGDGKNHSFTPDIATCQKCHTDATDFDVDGVQTEVKAELDKLGKALVAKGVLSANSPDGAPTVTEAPENVAFALYNWIYISQDDKSLGVHNAAYTKALPDASFTALGISK